MEEKKKLQVMMDQFRWYYNSTLTIVYNHYGHDKLLNKKKYSNYTIRDIIRKYEYKETHLENIVVKDFVYNENRNEIPIPPWWKNEVHNRLPRGAVDKFVSSLNSAISNFNNKNIRKFDMKYMTKKSKTDYLHFEDKSYPSFIKKIKSVYWYRSEGKRKKMSFFDICNQTKERGIEMIYEKDTDRYFIHYPVEQTWFPKEDQRNDNQIMLSTKENRVISLDPGVRKFLVGYDPMGNISIIGEKANQLIISLLLEVDKSKERKDRDMLWRKIKNLVSEMHWKSIHYLVSNYDIIYLPDFRVSEMIRSKKLSRQTKRVMCMFSFYSFKEKLEYKCKMYNKELIICDESFTSKTCTCCGKLNYNLGSSEVFVCEECDMIIDRDVNGARNILIKNIKNPRSGGF